MGRSFAVRGRLEIVVIRPVYVLYPEFECEVKARAANIFAGSGLARRADVVAAYAKALQLKGDAARGKAVFKAL